MFNTITSTTSSSSAAAPASSLIFDQWSVSMIYDLIKQCRLDLHPLYQRDNVWTVKDDEDLIDSLLSNMPVSIITLGELDGGKYEVMDGKQRITAIVRFITNEVAHTGDAISESRSVTYYSASPIKRGRSKLTSVFTESQRTRFNSLLIPVTIVSRDTPYNERVKIFHRLQRGRALKTGELLRARGNDATQYASELCETYAGKLAAYASTDRDALHIVILRLISYIDDGSVDMTKGNKKIDNMTISADRKGLICDAIKRAIVILQSRECPLIKRGIIELNMAMIISASYVKLDLLTLCAKAHRLSTLVREKYPKNTASNAIYKTLADYIVADWSA